MLREQSLEGLYASKGKLTQRELKKTSDRAVEKAVQRVVSTMTEEQVLKWRKVLANSPELVNREGDASCYMPRIGDRLRYVLSAHAATKVFR
jgi:hypothetical protein